MLKLKLLGVIMVVPTVAIAAIIVYVSRKTKDIYLNLAVLCWILANSYWMCIEFFTDERYRLWAAIPFGLGFIFCGHLLRQASPQKAPVNGII